MTFLLWRVRDGVRWTKVAASVDENVYFGIQSLWSPTLAVNAALLRFIFNASERCDEQSYQLMLLNHIK